MTTGITIRLGNPFSLIATAVSRPFKALGAWAFKGTFEGPRGLRRAEVWLAGPAISLRRRKVLFWTGVLISTLGVSGIAPLIFIAMMIGLDMTVSVPESFIGFMLTMKTSVVTSVCLMGIPFMKWVHYLNDSSAGPIMSIPCRREMPALRHDARDDPRRLADLEKVLSAPKMGSKSFMERLRRELGDADARALMLVLAFPEHADTLRGGELDELMTRVAGVDFSAPNSDVAKHSREVALQSNGAPVILVT